MLVGMRHQPNLSTTDFHFLALEWEEIDGRTLNITSSKICHMYSFLCIEKCRTFKCFLYPGYYQAYWNNIPLIKIERKLQGKPWPSQFFNLILINNENKASTTVASTSLPHTFISMQLPLQKNTSVSASLNWIFTLVSDFPVSTHSDGSYDMPCLTLRATSLIFFFKSEQYNLRLKFLTPSLARHLLNLPESVQASRWTTKTPEATLSSWS